MRNDRREGDMTLTERAERTLRILDVSPNGELYLELPSGEVGYIPRDIERLRAAK